MQCVAHCNKWTHGSCTELKKITSSSSRLFICRRYKDFGEWKEKPVEVLCDKIENVKGFCCLGDRLNVSG